NLIGLREAAPGRALTVFYYRRLLRIVAPYYLARQGSSRPERSSVTPVLTRHRVGVEMTGDRDSWPTHRLVWKHTFSFIARWRRGRQRGSPPPRSPVPFIPDRPPASRRCRDASPTTSFSRTPGTC